MTFPMIDDPRALIRNLSDVTWPQGAMLLVEGEDYEMLRKQTLAAERLNYFEIRASGGSVLEICGTEVYDRGAYRRSSEVMNSRIRPRGISMVPYACESCENQILLVTKKPTAARRCEVCQGRMVRTTT